MNWPEILLGACGAYALWKGYQKGLVGVVLEWVGFGLALALVYALFAGGTAFLEKIMPPALVQEGGKALALLLIFVAVRIGIWALTKATHWMAQKIGMETPYRLTGALLQLGQFLVLWSVVATWIAGFDGGEAWFLRIWPWSGSPCLALGRGFLAFLP
ncbi:MAG: CvpA family protein [Bacteroidota bacterium]